MTEHAEQRSVLYIRDMCCADEQNVIEQRLRLLAGVGEHRYNLIARKLYVSHSLPLNSIVKALGEVGFSATSLSQKGQAPQSFYGRHRDAIATAIAAVATIAGVVLQSLDVGPRWSIPVFALAILVGGWKIAAKGWKAASLFVLDMNVLMSIAVLGAVAIGKWEEGAAVIVLFAIAQFLEEISLRRTRKAISSLIELTPSVATVRNEGSVRQIPVDEVNVGDVIIVRPGEKIPVDGTISNGRSFVNQAAITGESAPVEKAKGDQVYAGTMNELGSFEFIATKVSEDTTLGHIIHLVEEAQAQRSPAQDFVERFAKIYTPVVIGMAVLIAIVPPLFVGQEFGAWFYRALVLLVIACPCALVISTPVSIVSGLTAAARQGILIKGGRYLEEAAKLKAIMFDKTGTLTRGMPSVTDVVQLNSLAASEILRIAALGELKSEHSLAHAIVAKAVEQEIELRSDVDSFESIPGRGILLSIEGKHYAVGNHQLVEERGLCSPEIESQLNRLESQGKTTVVVCSHEEVLGVIGVADPVREESRRAIQDLRDSGIQEIIMLSGDSKTIARSMAAEIGIDDHRGELLPADKLALVKEMRLKYGSVAMVGDGVNDAPALAASSLGIAMGVTGTDVALETADVVLMRDDLSKISSLISIGRRTMKVLRQNVAASLAVKAAFLLLAFFGAANLWTAVIADDGITLLVVLNSLRLLRKV